MDFANYFCEVLTPCLSFVVLWPTEKRTHPFESIISIKHIIQMLQYAKLYHQKDMLEDVRRMRAYHGAIVGNAECFKDKVRTALSINPNPNTR